MMLCQYKIYSNGIILGVIKSSTPDNHRNDTRNALGSMNLVLVLYSIVIVQFAKLFQKYKGKNCMGT